MSAEIRANVKKIINDYINGNITAENRDKALKSNGVELYSLMRARGKIKFVLSFDGKERETLIF